MSDDPTRSDVSDTADRSAASNGLRKLAQRLLHWLSRRNGDGSLRESLEEVFEVHEEGDRPVGIEERMMLLNIIKFAELSVDDLMVPRADIVAVDIATPFENLLPVFAEGGHSRLPLYKGTMDDIVGMIHIKDVMRTLADHEEDTPYPEIRMLKRSILFVPPSVPVIDLLLKMRTTRIHLALVVDEFGGTDGLVTIEDLIEEIVGDMEENEVPGETGPLLVARGEGLYDASARLPIADLEAELGLDLVSDDREEDIDTLGGLVVDLAGRVPERGEVISHSEGLEFEVLDADPRRLKRLRVRRLGDMSKAAVG